MTPSVPQEEWDAFIAGQKDPHLLQSSPWGELKASFGWRVGRVLSGDSGAQILFRPLPIGYSIAYIPKGPLGPWTPDLLVEIEAICRSRKAVFLKIEPDSPDDPEQEDLLLSFGFRRSSQTIQPRQTLIINLDGGEEAISARMRQKTRYNIRLAGKKGVQVQPWNDLNAFSDMMLKTGERDRFGVHTPEYYQKAYELFYPIGSCELFAAFYEGQPLAAILVFAFGSRAWYFYGASLDRERNRMPTYALQWAGIKWALGKGCHEYDLWGIPDVQEESLERDFTSRSDGLWGVYRFKRGFGGRLYRTIGAWDRVYNRPLYSFYNLVSTRTWSG